MTITHFDAEDARSDRAIAAREARRAAREETRPDTSPLAPVACEPTPTAAQAFTPVDSLPKRRAGLITRPVPEVRGAMIDYCIGHADQWVRYAPTPEADSTKPNTLVAYAKKRQGGFPAGFEVAVRDKIAYVRYVGSAS